MVWKPSYRYACSVLSHTWRGSGPRVVLLLHGFLGSSRNLGALARRWTAADPSVRLLQVDLPGHGQSPPLPTHATLVDMAQEVVAFLDTLDLPGSIAAVGHSMGGRVALAIRRASPNRIDRLTLLDITPGPTTGVSAGSVAHDLLDLPEAAEDRDAMAAPLRAKGHSAAMIDWLLMNLVREPDGYRWRIDRLALHELHLRSNALDFWPEVQQAPQDTVLIRGANSDYVSRHDLDRFLQLGVRVETIPRAGHFLHADRPDEVAEVVIRHALDNEP